MESPARRLPQMLTDWSTCAHSSPSFLLMIEARMYPHAIVTELALLLSEIGFHGCC